MRKTVIYSVAAVLLIISGAILLFQGFAMPAISGFTAAIMKILAAAALQVIFILNIKNRILRCLPLVFFAGLALWGAWLLLTSEHWKSVSVIEYAADYCTPLLGSALVFLCRKK